MTALTRHLREEQDLIREALDILVCYQRMLECGRRVAATELRTILFVINWISESSHLSKEEKILLPAFRERNSQNGFLPPNIEMGFDEDLKQIQTSHLRLRIAVDDYEVNFQLAPNLINQIIAYDGTLRNLLDKECVIIYAPIDTFLKEAEQIELLKSAREIQRQAGLEDLSVIRNLLLRLKDELQQIVA